MFWNLKVHLYVILTATIQFVSLVDCIKCLECTSIECRTGSDKPTSVNCGPNAYCTKIFEQKYGKEDVQRFCSSKKDLHATGLRLNECGFDKRHPKDKFPECICDSGDNCNSGYDFTPPTTGLKCLECTSDDCLYSIVKPTTISCQKGYYCEKYSYIENNTKFIRRNCQKQEHLLAYKFKLNDCGILVNGKSICYCNKDGCNSGDILEPKPNSGPSAIDCQKCDDTTTTKCVNAGHDIDKCEMGYICYKLFGIVSNVNRVVKRGCIHKEYSLDLGLKPNECGQFTNSYNEKQPICICDQDICNSGGGIQIENPIEEKEETPCPNSATIYWNQFFVMYIIFIGFIQYLFLTANLPIRQPYF